MIEKKNLYYIVKDGTKIIYKGKDEKKAKMYNNNVVAKEDAKEEAEEKLSARIAAENFKITDELMRLNFSYLYEEEHKENK